MKSRDVFPQLAKLKRPYLGEMTSIALPTPTCWCLPPYDLNAHDYGPELAEVSGIEAHKYNKKHQEGFTEPDRQAREKAPGRSQRAHLTSRRVGLRSQDHPAGARPGGVEHVPAPARCR